MKTIAVNAQDKKSVTSTYIHQQQENKSPQQGLRITREIRKVRKTKMMKSEFENLLGYEVDIDEYEKIETVYMQFDNNEMPKKKIAELYKNDSSFVTDTLYGYITRNEAENVERLKGINNMQRCIDDLRKDLKNACETIEKMVEDNGRLQEVSSWANKKIIEYIAENDEFKTRVEELETQLHQYKALFADMEKNATVSLYKTLLGVTE